MAKIIYNNYIPFQGFKAITIWPLVFARKKFRPLDDVTINHEGIHLIQQLEVIILSLLVLAIIVLSLHISPLWLLLSLASYYILYCLEYVIRLCAYGRGHEAYRNISFEQEAFLNERDFNYLAKDRKPFAWVKYLWRKTYRR